MLPFSAFYESWLGRKEFTNDPITFSGGGTSITRKMSI